jgi:antitoxin (DNA-binding transcriptional repressor) of toxin-antitoxin stability system
MRMEGEQEKLAAVALGGPPQALRAKTRNGRASALPFCIFLLVVIPAGNLRPCLGFICNVACCVAHNYSGRMQVNLQYAEEHFTDLVSAADSGQEVEISRPDKPALKLVVSKATAPVLKDGMRVLGAGIGELRVPSEEEWRAMDREMEREMLDAPLTTGEI